MIWIWVDLLRLFVILLLQHSPPPVPHLPALFVIVLYGDPASSGAVIVPLLFTVEPAPCRPSHWLPATFLRYLPTLLRWIPVTLPLFICSRSALFPDVVLVVLPDCSLRLLPSLHNIC